LAIEVWTAEDLDNVRNNLSGDYIQMADINIDGSFTTIGYLGENPWFTTFNGTYDGNGFEIKNASFHTYTASGSSSIDEKVGLFYQISGTVQNLTLRNCSVTAYIHGGILAAFVNGNVLNCHGINNNIVLDGGFGAGFISEANGEALIQHSSSDITINGGGAVGGMCGYFRGNAVIQESTVTVTIINSFGPAGGFIGNAYWTATNAIVKNCYSLGSIEGTENNPWPPYSFGGFIGQDDTYDGLTIINCYNSVELNVTATHQGGFIGNWSFGPDNVVIINCYYDTTVSGQTDDDGRGEPKTTAEMQSLETYIGWDFDIIWSMEENGYPVLRWSIETTDFNWENWDPDWDNWDWDWEDWDWSEELFDITFIVKNQLDELLPGAVIFLSHLGIQHTDGSGETIFTAVPIQYYTTYTVYLSNYEFYTGVLTFGTFQQHNNYEMTVEVTLEEKWISIYDYIDLYNIRYHLSGRYRLMNNISIARYANWLPIGNETNLPDSAFTGQLDGNGYEISGMNIISGTNDYQGLFGAIHGAEIKQMGIRNSKCSGNNCALLVGYCYDSLIEECYAAGEVSGTGICGGLVSNVVNSNLLNCYSRTEVEGNIAGGLAGQLDNTTGTHLYSSEAVDGIINSGGLIGLMGGSTFIYCYYDTEVSSQNDTGKGIPTLTEDMKKQVTYLNWNFINVWDIDEIIYGS
jgi:hypothetical protein